MQKNILCILIVLAIALFSYPVVGIQSSTTVTATLASYPKQSSEQYFPATTPAQLSSVPALSSYINPCTTQIMITGLYTHDLGILFTPAGNMNRHWPNQGGVGSSCGGNNCGSGCAGWDYASGGYLDGVNATFSPNALFAWSLKLCSSNYASMQIAATVYYADQNGYAWDGSTCSQIIAKITSINVSFNPGLMQQPVVKGSSATIECNVSSASPDIQLVTNVSSDGISSAVPTVGGANFTLTFGGVGDDAVACTIGGDLTSSLNATVTVLPARVAGINGLSSGIDCVDNLPVDVNLTWLPQGSPKYAVFVNNTLFTSTALPSVLVTGLSVGSSYNFSVLGYDSYGDASTNTTVTIGNYTCPPPGLEVPDYFHHAFFSRVRDRSVTAYWNEDGEVIIYQNFVTDFSTIFPSDEYTLMNESRQFISLGGDPGNPSDVLEWRHYTSGLVIDPTVTGTPLSLVTS